jgi:hypothetical protein
MVWTLWNVIRLQWLLAGGFQATFARRRYVLSGYTRTRKHHRDKTHEKRGGAVTTCSTCPGVALLVRGAVIYPHRPELAEVPFWRCNGCGGYVGCHPGTERPLGTCAGPELRRARKLLHARFEPLWTHARAQGSRAARRARMGAYSALGAALGIEGGVHFGEMDLATCRLAWRALDTITLDTVRQFSRGAPHTDNRPLVRRQK